MTRSRNKAKGEATPFIEVAPNATRTLTALREMGYSTAGAIMDLIDNSLDAGAKRVDVTLRRLSGKGQGFSAIDILDDGRGMDAETLAQALRLGSEVDHDDDAKRLGKFGMGLITASISMARNVWVLTRPKGSAGHDATFDLDTVAREGKFVITLQPAASRRVVEVFGADGGGTLVRLSRIDRLDDTNPSRFVPNLRTLLGRVYRHYLTEGVHMTVNGTRVQMYDPLMLDHPQTEVVLEQAIDLGDGTRANLTVVELPELGMSGDSDADITPRNSGFYVVRNRREIIAHETFGFYQPHHSYSHFRAELAYQGESTAFRESVKKDSIHPDDRLRDKLERIVKPLIEASGRRGKQRDEARPLVLNSKAADWINAKLAPPVPEKVRPSEEPAEATMGAVEFTTVPAAGKDRFFHAEEKDHRFIIYHDSKHPFVRMVADEKQKASTRIFELMTYALARAEQEVGPKGDALALVERAGLHLAELAKA